MDKLITIEVAYALPNNQTLLAISVTPETTVAEGIKLSGILAKYPEINLSINPIGIFGKKITDPQQRLLQAGDRIEIYRPLQADPKEVRRRRAEKAALNKKA